MKMTREKCSGLAFNTFQAQLHRRVALVGDLRSLVLSRFVGTWNCIHITALLQSGRCKYVFSDGVCSIQSFCHYWQEEVCMQLSARGYILIKDAKELDNLAYREFIAALVALRKRI